MNHRDTNPWLPFDSTELQLVLGVFGFGATLLTVFGIDPVVLAVGSGAYLLFVYLAGLLVHARRAARGLSFLTDGALGGQGYVESPARASVPVPDASRRRSARGRTAGTLQKDPGARNCMRNLALSRRGR